MIGDRKEIGRRIRLIRTRLGYNQKDFGEFLAVATSSVSAYEKGETSPSFSVVARIAELGNISIDDLLTGGPAGAPPRADHYDWVKADEEQKGIAPISVNAITSTQADVGYPPISEIMEAISKLFSFVKFIETPTVQAAMQQATSSPSLTEEEHRLLDAFRKLDDKRRSRLVEDAEDMLLAMSNRG